MTELEKINKVINDLYDIRDVALSVFGDEGYFALDDSIRSLTKTWSICKRGQEEKLRNAYHTPVNNSRRVIRNSLNKKSREFLDELWDLITGNTDYDVTLDSFWEKWVDPYENVSSDGHIINNDYSIPYEVDTGNGIIRLGEFKLTLGKNDLLFEDNPGYDENEEGYGIEDDWN